MTEEDRKGHGPSLTAYDPVQTLPKCDIAWEFLRRNADYRRDFELYGSDALIRERDWQGYPVYRQTRICDTAKRWGLSAFCAPDQLAPVEHLFWLRDHRQFSPSVLITGAGGESAELFKCATPRFLIDLENTASLYLRMGRTRLTLPVLDAFPFNSGDGLALTITNVRELAGVLRFSRALRQTQTPPVWTAQRLSLRDTLIAFDGATAGFCYRDIARQIVGEARVEEDWRIGSTALKDRIRRAVKRGERLVGGGYRELLRV